MICCLVIVIVHKVGFCREFVEEEGKFEVPRVVEMEGVCLGPLRSPGFLDSDGLGGKGVGGDGVEVPHVMVDCLVVDGGLID